MAIIDRYFNNLVNEILENGKWQEPEDVRAVWDDGSPSPAKSITDVQWKFDNSECLAPTTKVFHDVLSLRELWWIWVHKTNVVQDLRNMNKNNKSIWDKWEYKEGPWKGTIGPAYGYVLAQPVRKWKVSKVNQEHLSESTRIVIKTAIDLGIDYIMLDQVDDLIQTLVTNPGSRRIITTLWIPKYLDEMFLTPCVWNTQWLRWDGKLNLTVNIRSNDICVGNSFNVFQYQVLQHMIAQVTNIPVGTLTFNITDAHIYDRHIDIVKEQVQEELQEAATLVINPNIKNFYDFKISDIRLENKPVGVKDYKYEVSK